MAGLLDWLTNGIGSQMGSSSSPMVDATNNYVSPGSAPLSPDEQPQIAPPAPPAPPTAAVPAPSAPAPPVDPSTTGAAPPAAPPPVQMSRPRPTGSPTATAATAGPGTGAPLNITPPAPNPDSGPSAPPVIPAPSSFKLGGQTALGRAIGIDPNSNGFRSAMAGLGEGLTAAGNSKGKSAGQAFASGAGGALTGATKQDSTQYDQRLKALQLAVDAQAKGDKAAYDINYLKYKVASEKNSGSSSSKNSSWNKPDSQKFIDAQNAMAKDPDIRASEKMLEGVVAGGNSPLNQPRIEAAQAAHTALVQQKQQMYLAGVGLNPAQIQANIANPPGTPQNPHVVNSRADFDTYVKPGQAYRNPRDGKIYIRKVGDHMDDDAPDQQTPAAPAPSAPATPGPAPTALDPEEGERD